MTVQQGSMADTMRGILFCVPSNMKTRRSHMDGKRGRPPGIRGAAKQIGISPTTYLRVERGDTPDVPTLLKILDWLSREQR